MLCIQQPAFVGYNNSTITEKLQALFLNYFPKRGGMLYFWHNAQIPERFTDNLTKHETAGCSKQEHSKFL